jgi:hypothetical protein
MSGRSAIQVVEHINQRGLAALLIAPGRGCTKTDTPVQRERGIPHSAVWKKIFLNKSGTLASMRVLPVLLDTNHRIISMYIK